MFGKSMFRLVKWAITIGIALVAGASLIFKTKFHKEVPAGSCSFIGYAVIVLSIIVILFSGYGMFRGYFMHRAMMRKMVPMMQQMMKNGCWHRCR